MPFVAALIEYVAEVKLQPGLFHKKQYCFPCPHPPLELGTMLRERESLERDHV